MNFTPQQLSGGIKFNSITKLGNWQEERIIEEQKAREVMMLAGKARQTMNNKTTKLDQFLEPVALSSSSDGKLRYGDTVALYHPLTDRYLASDITNPVYSGFEKYLVSGYKLEEEGEEEEEEEAFPSRVCFVVTPPPSSSFQKGDIVRFEDPCLLEVHGSILLNPSDYTLERDRMFLASSRKDEVNVTRLSNEQLVFMTALADHQALWKILPSEESDRMQTMSNPSDIGHVPTNVPLFFLHASTNLPLTTADTHLDLTDFGTESEVCCTASSLDVEERRGRRRTLEREGSGRPQTTTLLQGSSQKKWVIVAQKGGSTADSDPSALYEEKEQEEEQDWTTSMDIPDNEDLIHSEISFVLQFLVEHNILEDNTFWEEKIAKQSINNKIDCEDLRFALLDFIQDEKEKLSVELTSSYDQLDQAEEEGTSPSIPTKHEVRLLIDYLIGSDFHPLIKISHLRKLLETMKET